MSWRRVRISLRRRQVHTPTVYQAQTTECPVAALAMILAYYGRHVPLEELRAAAGTSRDCANAADVLRAARQFGLSGRAQRAEIEDLPRIGFPLMAHVRFIHFVVVEDIRHGRVMMNDPAAGRHDIPLEEFNEKFTGVVLKFEPAREFLPGGSPVSVVKSLGRRIGEPRAGRSLLLIAWLCGMLLVLPLIMTAVLAGGGIDAYLIGDRALPPNVWWASCGAVVFAWLALYGCRELARAGFQQSFTKRHTTKLLGHLRQLPFAFFTYRLPGDLQSVVLANRQLAELVGGHLLPTATAPTTMMAIALAMAWYDLLATAVVIGLAAIHVVIAQLLKRARPRRVVQTAYRDAWGSAVLSAQRIEMLRSGGLDNECLADVCSGSAAAISIAHEQAELQAWERGFASLVELLVVSAVIVTGGLGMIDAQLSLGAVAALLLLSAALLRTMRIWTADEGRWDKLHEIVHALEDVESIEVENCRRDSPDRKASDEAHAQLALHDVTFGYALGKPPKVDGISLTLQPGMRLGITGPSGGGKSTLSGLLAGLHRPWSGRVELDGRPLDSIPRSELARSIGWVNKTPTLYECTIRENLTLWDERINDQSLEAAMRDACLAEILDRSTGLDTIVESRGRNFSGGQRQRLEIARVLARNPKIVILDEAMDALQPEIERRILENIHRRGCTTIIVTHRASTLRLCEDVVTINHGRRVSPQTMPADENRRQIVAAHEDSPFHNSASALARSASDVQSVEATVPASTLQAAMVSAFRRIAAANGQAVELDCEQLTEAGHEGVMQLARRSGMRARRVRMVLNEWWRSDNGPLLAFHAEKGHPVALLARVGTGYVMVDSQSDTRQKLTAPLADQLDRNMYMLYPTLPDHVRGPSELLALAARRSKVDLSVAMLAGAMAGMIAAVFLPVAALTSFERLVPADSTILYWKLSASLTGIALAVPLFEIVRSLSESRAHARTVHLASAWMWERLLRLPLPFFRQRRATEVASVSHNLTDLRQQTIDSWLTIAACGFVLLPALAVMGWISPRLFAVASGLIGLPVIVLPLLAFRLLPIRRATVEQRTRSALFLFDMLVGVARLRNCDVESNVADRWESQLRDELDLDRNLAREESMQEFFEVLYPSLATLGLLAAIVLGWTGDLGGGFIGFQVALLFSLTGAASTGAALANLVRSRLARQRVEPVFESPFETSVDKKEPGILSGEIEVKDVAFSYNGSGTSVFSGLSLRIEPGEFVALAGRSGAGKSTLLRLLLGFEVAQRGRISFDGAVLDELDLNALRSQLGVVLQEDQVAVSTLRHNICGTSPYPLDKVWRAAQLAGIDNDIRQMPMGIQTILEDGRLSSGQKQRVLLAARLLRRPRILLLDEATSALDEDLECQVFQNLKSLGVTCLFVAHRASSVRHADRVYVIEDGCVVQSGRPAEVLADREGLLAHLHTSEREDELERRSK